MNFFVWIYRSTSQEINIRFLFAKFEANIAELDTVTVSGRSFKIYSRLLDFGITVSHLDQCRSQEVESIVTGSVVINEWQVSVVSNQNEEKPGHALVHLKCFTLMLHYFE